MNDAIKRHCSTSPDHRIFSYSRKKNQEVDNVSIDFDNDPMDFVDDVDKDPDFVAETNWFKFVCTEDEYNQEKCGVPGVMADHNQGHIEWSPNYFVSDWRG